MASRAFVRFVMWIASGLFRMILLFLGVVLVLLLVLLFGEGGDCSARHARVREGRERGDLTGEVFFFCLVCFVEGNGDGTDSTLPSIAPS